MSTRCQIEFRSRDVRRTVYRHSDGYPSAVVPDLREFLAWCERRDAEYAAANFIFWSKRALAARWPSAEQLGFGVCANDELHDDIEYYYVVDLREEHIVVFAALSADDEVDLLHIATEDAA